MTKKSLKNTQQQQQHIPNSNIFTNAIQFIHNHVGYLNNSKFFAGCVMILLNIGSKFITIQFSKSAEEYLKLSVCKEILVFSMAWMGTRDIYAALGLTAVFVILSDHLFNEESRFCVVPENYRVLSKLETVLDENKDGIISDEEVNSAIAVLEKAKKEKQKQQQQQLYSTFKEVANK
jgi:hypothetical protein